MKTDDIIIVHPENNEDIHVLMAFMKALNIKFEISKAYKKEFIAKIKKSEHEYKNGDFTIVKEEDIDTLLGI